MDSPSKANDASAEGNSTLYARPAKDLGLLTVEEMPSKKSVNARTILSQREDYVIELRHDSNRRSRGQLVESDRPWYRCIECETALRVRADKREDLGHAYYFKHPHKSPECSLKRDREEMTKDEINAARYQGLPEGRRHIRLKNLILMSVSADPALQDIEKEHRLYHRVDPKRYRTPDVSFIASGVRVAVEAQVSNTSLEIMLDRQDFYADDRALLLWVVDVAPEGDILMYLKDVRAVHNGNIFVVDERSRDESFAKQAFVLWCYYEVPTVTKAGELEDIMTSQLVKFSDLQKDPEFAELWYFDRRAALAKAEMEAMEIRVRRQAAAVAEQRQREDAFAIKVTHTTIPIVVSASDPFGDCRVEYYGDLTREKMDVRHKMVEFVLDSLAGTHSHNALQDQAFYVFALMRKAGVKLPSYQTREYGHIKSRLEIFLSARFRRPVRFSHSTLVALAHHVAVQYEDALWYFRQICLQYGGAEVIAGEDTTGNWARKEIVLQNAWKASKHRPDPRWLALCAVLFPEVEIFQRLWNSEARSK